MAIHLLENTLKIDVFYDCEDQDLEDNVCVSIIESCPPAERIMRVEETHIFLTPDQARELGEALLRAANHSNSGWTK